MALSDIRNKVMELGGRFDLDDAEAYVGIDDFIRSGQKTLDKMLDRGKTVARHFQNLAYQQLLLQVPGARTIERVVLIKSDQRYPITKVDLEDLKNAYYEKHSLITVGPPTYWSPVDIRPYPSVVDPTLYNQSWAFDDVVVEGSDEVNGILLMPPCDSASAYTIEVFGKFWTEMPTNPEGTSFWISQHPTLLQYAALYHLEISYRNTEGANDWMKAIKLEIEGLNMDIYEDEDINQMEG